MKQPIRPGATGTVRFTVTEDRAIDFDATLPAMLSTPSLVWFLEQAAIAVLHPGLEQGEVSLGTEVSVQHLAPTPVGVEVVCRAQLLQADGNRFLFQVEASDDRGLIARGTHRRVVVPVAGLARRLSRPGADGSAPA